MLFWLSFTRLFRDSQRHSPERCGLSQVLKGVLQRKQKSLCTQRTAPQVGQIQRLLSLSTKLSRPMLLIVSRFSIILMWYLVL